MNDWEEIKPKYKRSREDAPFCPMCDMELDEVDMINLSFSCECGRWTQGINGIRFKRREKN